MIIPCLSIRNPWAWAITAGFKTTENRTRRFNHRGPLLIHAGKLPYDGFEEARNEIIEITGGVAEPPWLDELDFGGIVGACLLTGCEGPGPGDGAWKQSGCVWLKLEKAIPLPFRAYRGMQGLFRVELTASEETALRDAQIL